MGTARKTGQAPNPKYTEEGFKKGLENVIKMPKGTGRSMSFIELMLTGGASGKDAIRHADSPKTAEPSVERKEQNTFKSDFDDVRKRLLDKAKEERIQKQDQLTREKEVYGQSLPNSMQKNPYE